MPANNHFFSSEIKYLFFLFFSQRRQHQKMEHLELGTLKVPPSAKTSEGMIDDFLKTSTPSVTHKRITISGRLSDPTGDIVIQRYSDHTTDITHPRNTANTWKVGSRRLFNHTKTMRTWLDKHIRLYMTTRLEWQSEVFPQRTLYCYGTRGNGRAMCVTNFCAENKINLLFVKHNTHTKDVFFSVFEKAKAIQPCIVYFNNATTIFSNAEYTKELMSAYSNIIDSAALDIWLVFAGSYPPDRLIAHNRHTAHRAYKLFEQQGEIVHVPCISTLKDAEYVAIEFLRELSQNSNYPPTRGMSLAWQSVLEKLAGAFIFNTMYEIRSFLHNVFRDHNINTAATARGDRCWEPHETSFVSDLVKFPVIESNGQNYRRLCRTRDSYADHKTQNQSWSEYAAVMNIDIDSTPPAPEYSYVPSMLNNSSNSTYEINSISSPSRDYVPVPPVREYIPETRLPLLPHSVPPVDRRKTKRQRMPEPKHTHRTTSLPAHKHQRTHNDSRSMYDYFRN